MSIVQPENNRTCQSGAQAGEQCNKSGQFAKSAAVESLTGILKRHFKRRQGEWGGVAEHHRSDSQVLVSHNYRPHHHLSSHPFFLIPNLSLLLSNHFQTPCTEFLSSRPLIGHFHTAQTGLSLERHGCLHVGSPEAKAQRGGPIIAMLHEDYSFVTHSRSSKMNIEISSG